MQLSQIDEKFAVLTTANNALNVFLQDILEELGQSCKKAQPSPRPHEVGTLEC